MYRKKEGVSVCGYTLSLLDCFIEIAADTPSPLGQTKPFKKSLSSFSYLQLKSSSAKG